MSKNRVFSGLNRVSQRIQEELAKKGEEVIPVAWSLRNGRYLTYPNRKPICLAPQDVFITPELFCEEERPGVNDWVKDSEGVCAAIFHDAIPLKHPEFTWPKSVARHPFYMKDLAGYDLILANSDTSRKELSGYLQWLELGCASDEAANHLPPIVTIPLGADFAGEERILEKPKQPKDRTGPLQMLMVGILEPRKNQEVVLGAMEILRTQGKAVQLSIVGRVNPHYGKSIQKRIDELIRSGLPIRFHRQVEDAELIKLYEATDISLFPSIVEGNGLPVIESLWRGIPTIASPIGAHLEHAGNGEGILVVDPMTPANLAATLDTLIDEPGQLQSLQEQVYNHPLPTWGETVDSILTAVADAQSAKSSASSES